MRHRALSLVAVLFGLAISDTAFAQCAATFGCDNSIHGRVGGRVQGIPPSPVTRIPTPSPYTHRYRELPSTYTAYGSVYDYAMRRNGRVVAPPPAAPLVYYQDEGMTDTGGEFTFPAGQQWVVRNKDGSLVQTDVPPPIGEKPYRGARWGCRLDEPAKRWHCLWVNPRSRSPSLALRFYGDYYY